MAIDTLETPKSDLVHYQNLLKILDWDGYSRWDPTKQEMIHYLWVYRRFIIDENAPNAPTNGSSWAELCKILGYDE